jgi:hypothetical protein
VGNDNIPTGCFQHENGRNSTGRPGPNATLKFEQHLEEHSARVLVKTTGQVKAN